MNGRNECRAFESSLRRDHGVWLTVANLLTLGVEILPIAPSFVVGNLQDNLMRWVRAAELSCDRAALLVAGDAKVVVSVLMKLSGGCPKLAGKGVSEWVDRHSRAAAVMKLYICYRGNTEQHNGGYRYRLLNWCS